MTSDSKVVFFNNTATHLFKQYFLRKRNVFFYISTSYTIQNNKKCIEFYCHLAKKVYYWSNICYEQCIIYTPQTWVIEKNIVYCCLWQIWQRFWLIKKVSTRYIPNRLIDWLLFNVTWAVFQLQWKLSTPNLLGTNYYVRNREVFGLYRLK